MGGQVASSSKSLSHLSQERVWLDDMEMPKTPSTSRFSLAIEYCREKDDRWLADIPALPGVTAYGRAKKQATAAVQALVLRLIADRLGARGSGPGPHGRILHCRLRRNPQTGPPRRPSRYSRHCCGSAGASTAERNLAPGSGACGLAGFSVAGNQQTVFRRFGCAVGRPHKTMVCLTVCISMAAWKRAESCRPSARRWPFLRLFRGK
jgi:hypothetical protein